MVARTTKTVKKSGIALAEYCPTLVPVADIKPAPENDDLYREIVHDEQMDALIESIGSRGLEEPLILTADNDIISGPRRFYAVAWLGWDRVPCRRKQDIRWVETDEFHSVLAEHNSQRIKSVGSLLKETLLRDQSPEDTCSAIREHQQAPLRVDVDFMSVEGEKHVRDVSEKKRPFLEAVQAVIETLRDYWPLSIRQIHYKRCRLLRGLGRGVCGNWPGR